MHLIISERISLKTKNVTKNVWLIYFFTTQFFSQFFIAFISLDIAWKDLNIAEMVQV